MCVDASNREAPSGGLAKRLQTLGMRRGWVVRKDMTSGLDQMFVVRFPRMGAVPMKTEVREKKRGGGRGGGGEGEGRVLGESKK